ncbi:hypothetical protein O9G_000390 [Rozella allomycis CSF55]|uniref:Uncharacterized protein n=1 Tax=Rozella allomycis (strain CSF55) TaxID=988480 RepID=A0A075AU10_ROZAC|nr:hypothetical protein O9G_000390 [Rozella allomycis CSF55]|eukprot:EPZ33615.1 hypothetical protein O9G_000390 [Rozella allomycis CSF55]
MGARLYLETRGGWHRANVTTTNKIAFCEQTTSGVINGVPPYIKDTTMISAQNRSVNTFKMLTVVTSFFTPFTKIAKRTGTMVEREYGIEKRAGSIGALYTSLEPITIINRTVAAKIIIINFDSRFLTVAFVTTDVYLRDESIDSNPPVVDTPVTSKYAAVLFVGISSGCKHKLIDVDE